jgi:hypothetical protein
VGFEFLTAVVMMSCHIQGALVMLISCLAHSSTFTMEAICSSENQLPFNGPHGVVFQNIILS